MLTPVSFGIQRPHVVEVKVGNDFRIIPASGVLRHSGHAGAEIPVHPAEDPAVAEGFGLFGGHAGGDHGFHHFERTCLDIIGKFAIGIHGCEPDRLVDQLHPAGRRTAELTGILQNRCTYEILDPAELGIVQNNIVLGKHSGKHALKEYLESMDIKMSNTEMNELFEKFKELADKKKVVTNKDIMYLLSHSHNIKTARVYTIDSYSIMTVMGRSAVATLKLRTDEGVKIGEGVGDGPLDAAFKTINRIIGKDFLLLDWSSSAITEGEDALGAATLRLAFNGKQVTGRGVSTDTVEASILAYINACNKLLQ